MPTRDPREPVASRRYDLDVLDFGAVRELLVARLATSLGRAAVASLQPLNDYRDAVAALAQVSEIAGRLRRDEAAPLAGAVEVRPWLAAFFAGEHSADGRDVADLKRLLRTAGRCKRWLSAAAEDTALLALATSFPAVDDIVGELETVVDDRGEVLSTASVKLADIRREIEAAEAGVRAAVQRFVDDDGVRRCLQTPEPSWRHGRPVFQIKQEHRHKIAGVLHDRSQSGATLFVEPSAVVDAANRLSDARTAERHEIQVILAQTCRGLRNCRDELSAAAETVALLDLRAAGARLIVEDDFVAPAVTADGVLRICSGRHPLLLQLGGETVPLDIALGDPHTCLVVTGPNTGGKTVVLKTVGVLAVMALCGVPVPAAAGTRIPALDGVFVDIGDEQGIAQSLSTFSSHVRRIARCLNAASPRSLVLLDELGAGTDPEEGGALGYAVLESLERTGVRAVVTTHLGRLKEFAYRHSGADNGSMAFDGQTLRPLFRLEVGIPGCSHALDIAGQVGMPQDLVDRAKSLLAGRDRTMEEVVQRVQEVRREAEADRRRSAELNESAAAAERETKDRLQELDRRRAWLQEEADSYLDEQLRELRGVVAEFCKQLQNAPKPFGVMAGELQQRVRAAAAAASVHRRRMAFLGGLRKDGVVFVPRLRRRCVVRKIDRVKEVCTVEVGKIRMELPFEEISWLQPLDV